MVVVRAAAQYVAAIPAQDDVIAAEAVDLVAPCSSVNYVVPAPVGVDPVVSAAADDEVVAGAVEQAVGATGFGGGGVGDDVAQAVYACGVEVLVYRGEVAGEGEGGDRVDVGHRAGHGQAEGAAAAVVTDGDVAVYHPLAAGFDVEVAVLHGQTYRYCGLYGGSKRYDSTCAYPGADHR